MSKEADQKQVTHAVIAGALFDFMGWLTSRKERLSLSSSDDASPVVMAITEFAKMRGLSLEDAKVIDWNAALQPPAQQEPVAKSLLVNLYNTGYKDGHHDTVEGQYTDVHQSDMDTHHLDVVANWLEENPPAQRTWVGLTKEEVDSWELPDSPTVFEFTQFVEAKLKEKNT